MHNMNEKESLFFIKNSDCTHFYKNIFNFLVAFINKIVDCVGSWYFYEEEDYKHCIYIDSFVFEH